MNAPQEARGRVWVEEILSVSPCAANGCEWRRKLPVRNRRTRGSGSMGRSWYLRRALVVRVFTLIIRAWWAVTFLLHWVRTCTVSRRMRVVWACFREVWSISFMSKEGTFEGEHLLLRRAHECLTSVMGEGYREGRETAGGRHGDTSKIGAGARAAGVRTWKFSWGLRLSPWGACSRPIDVR